MYNGLNLTGPMGVIDIIWDFPICPKGILYYGQSDLSWLSQEFDKNWVSQWVQCVLRVWCNMTWQMMVWTIKHCVQPYVVTRPAWFYRSSLDRMFWPLISLRGDKYYRGNRPIMRNSIDVTPYIDASLCVDLRLVWNPQELADSTIIGEDSVIGTVWTIIARLVLCFAPCWSKTYPPSQKDRTPAGAWSRHDSWSINKLG